MRKRYCRKLDSKFIVRRPMFRMLVHEDVDHGATKAVACHKHLFYFAKTYKLIDSSDQVSIFLIVSAHGYPVNEVKKLVCAVERQYESITLHCNDSLSIIKFVEIALPRQIHKGRICDVTFPEEA